MQFVPKPVRILTVQKQLRLLLPGIFILLFSCHHWKDSPLGLLPKTVGLLSAGHYCCQAISQLPFINIFFPTNKYYICKEMCTDMLFPARAHIWQKGFFGFVGHLQRSVSIPASWAFARLGNSMSSWAWRIAHSIDHSFQARPDVHCKGDRQLLLFPTYAHSMCFCFCFNRPYSMKDGMSTRQK